LAQVVKGTSPESLLDTYHSERHAIDAVVLPYTTASIVLRRDDGRRHCATRLPISSAWTSRADDMPR